MFSSRISASALCVLALVVSPGLAAAAEPTEIGSVTTSDRHNESLLLSARPTYIVTRDQIEARGNHTIADALRQTPGVAVLPYGSFGSQSTVLIRGASSSTQVLVLLDGFPIQSGSTGLVDLGSMSTVGVARIEVLESGASTLYGSSAVSGVINIITGAAAKPDIAVSAGSFGDKNARAAVALPVGKQVVGLAAERHLATNNYPYASASTYGSPSAIQAGSRLNADAALSTGRFTIDGPVGKGLHYHLLADSTAMQLGVPNAVTSTDHAARQDTQRNDFGVAIERTSSRSMTTLSLSSVLANLRYRDLGSLIDPTLPASALYEDTTDDRRNDLSLRNLTGGKHARLLTGMDLSRETAGIGLGFSALPAPPSSLAPSESQSAFYAQYEHDLAQHGRIYGGLRYEHDAPQGTALSPAVGASLPLGELRFAVNAASAFRVPTLSDLYYPGFSNPQLLPERSRNYDATLSDAHILGGVSLGVFSRNASNLIALDANFVPQNLAHSSTSGIVASATTLPFHGLVASASFTDNFRAVGTPAATALDQSPTRLLYVPSSITTLALEHLGGAGLMGYGIDATIYGAVAQYGGDVINGWTTLDAFVRVPVSRFAFVNLRARNLADEHYETHEGYPQPGRSFEVELSTH